MLDCPTRWCGVWRGRHTFDYILHLPSMLLFLSLSDDDSTTRETFRYLEVWTTALVASTHLPF